MISHRLLLICCLSIATASYRLNIAKKPSIDASTQSQIDPTLLQQIKAIAVKVTANRSSGSGIIMHKKNKIYSVVTNRHVVDRGDKYQVQIGDRTIYPARLIEVSQQNDLAILQFTSDRIYPIAKINAAPLKLGDFLLSTGFPFNSDRLQITSGKLSLKTNKPLKQGYQLGYSNIVHKGMSGGAVFNSLGEVVGVNGRSANPIIADYQYQDSTYPNRKLKQQMTELSWGIPINKAVDFVNVELMIDNF